MSHLLFLLLIYMPFTYMSCLLFYLFSISFLLSNPPVMLGFKFLLHTVTGFKFLVLLNAFITKQAACEELKYRAVH
jgi:hypothetical protein